MNKFIFPLAILALSLCAFTTESSAQASGVKPELIMYRHNGGAISPAPGAAGNVLGTIKWNALTAIGNIRTGASRFNGNTSVGGNLNVDLSASVDGALQVNGNGRVDGILVVGNPISIPGNHELYVNGSVVAEEIWVKLQGSWPDYVFEQDYRLSPLTKVENTTLKAGRK